MKLSINKLRKSPIKIKICSFFNQNPSAIDTARNIALWINHDLKETECTLEKLVNDKILLAHRISSATAYAYTRDRDVTIKIKKLLGLKKEVGAHAKHRKRTIKRKKGGRKNAKKFY